MQGQVQGRTLHSMILAVLSKQWISFSLGYSQTLKLECFHQTMVEKVILILEKQDELSHIRGLMNPPAHCGKQSRRHCGWDPEESCYEAIHSSHV